jgi:hypothetical protein
MVNAALLFDVVARVRGTENTDELRGSAYTYATSECIGLSESAAMLFGVYSRFVPDCCHFEDELCQHCVA